MKTLMDVLRHAQTQYLDTHAPVTQAIDWQLIGIDVLVSF